MYEYDFLSSVGDVEKYRLTVKERAKGGWEFVDGGASISGTGIAGPHYATGGYSALYWSYWRRLLSIDNPTT